MVPENTPRRRGRPKKEKQPENPDAIPTPPAENPQSIITHKFCQAIYKDGADPISALSTAEDHLLQSESGVLESFQTLSSMATLGLELAREKADPTLIEALSKKQAVFSSVVRRLSQPESNLPHQSPINPSLLPPMTARKR